jgi:DNA-binding MarR family transcriptional regulator
MEVVNVKDVTLAEAEGMIETYLREQPGPNFASEIADALELDYHITFKAIDRLLKEGRIKKAKK